MRRDLASVAVGIVPPMSWAFEAQVFDFHYDPAEARRLLDQAGFPDPDGDGPLPRFRLSLKTSTSEIYRVQAAVIQQDLARVGIAVDVRSSELLTLLADAARGNFQMYTLQWVGITDPDMLRRVYHSKQVPPVGLNRVFYQNPEVDRLIDAAAAAVSEAERKPLYSAAQRLIAEDVPYISLWYKTNVAVAQPDLRGVQLSPIADFTFLRKVSRVPPRRAAGNDAARHPRQGAQTRGVAGARRLHVGTGRRRLALRPAAPLPHHRARLASTSISIRAKRRPPGGWPQSPRRSRRVSILTLGRASGRVHVVLVNQNDMPNGWATPVPYNLIEITAAGPGGESSLGNTDDWLRLVFTHEYTHIVHLGRSDGWIAGLRRGFGRNPALFPNLTLPLWAIEGIATFEESAETGRGRVNAGDFRQIVTRAASAARFEPLDGVGGGLDDWPSGNAQYRLRRPVPPLPGRYLRARRRCGG